MKVNKEGT